MKKTKVLVLGNDPQINLIDFNQLDRSIITLGVNRIWLKFAPNYLFFNDPEIIKELGKYPEKMAQLRQTTNFFTSDWLRRIKTSNIPSWVRSYDRYNKQRFPDSVTNSIDLFKRNIAKEEIIFYVAGVSLRWQEPSHFWKEEQYPALNKHGENWYLPRFEKIFDNFKYLKDLGYNIISVNPQSNLNKLFRYENIENLYSKKLK